MAGGSGSAGDAAKQSPRGRHHRTGGGEFWTPAVLVGASTAGSPRSRHAKPATGPIVAAVLPRSRQDQPTWPPAIGQLSPIDEAEADRLGDTGAIGLHKFDLGYIPASVTPPRTWRKAAWFTVICSAAALVGLLYVTAELVGPVHVASDIDSLPGLPTNLPFFTPPSSSGNQPGVRHSQPQSRPDQQQRPNQPGSTAAPTDAQGRPITTADGSSSAGGLPPSGGGAPGTGNAPTTVVEPPPVTTVNSGPPSVDPTKLGTRTEQFFSEVTSNVDAAASMTSDTVHGDAKAIIEQNYGDISTIKVKSISLDPTNGLTVSVLQVTNKDGSVLTQQRTLRFTLSGDPKIENPGG